MDDEYDSDSSLGDADSGVSTNVLLGYATKDAVDDTFSQLGGRPTWFQAARHPPLQLVKCKSCNGYMTLLLQLNGDLPARFPMHERRLYIWQCRKRACRRKDGSVRAVRAVRVSTQAAAQTNGPDASRGSSKPPAEVSNEKQDIGSTLFGAKPSSASANANPFSSHPSSGTQNPFSAAPAPPSALAAKPPQRPVQELSETFAQKARISSPTKPTAASTVPTTTSDPWPSPSEFPKPYPSYYLDADYEYLSPTTTTAGLNTASSSTSNYAAFMDLDADPDDEEMDVTLSNAPSSSKKGSKESTSAKAKARAKADSQPPTDNDNDETPHDKAFLHFADTLAQNPEQVLRYEFGGAPLLYSRTDPVGRLFARHADAAASSANVKVSTTTAAAGPGASGKGMPRCPRCGAERAFELQLTPHAIAELEAEEEAATLLKEGMEWGAVILGVCSADCCVGGEGGGGGEGIDDEDDGEVVRYYEEWVGVQWEEVVDARGESRRRL